jgi:hypothetical protein
MYALKKKKKKKKAMGAPGEAGAKRCGRVYPIPVLLGSGYNKRAMKWSAHDTDRRRRICWYVVGRLRDVECAFGLSWSNVWKKEEGAPK